MKWLVTLLLTVQCTLIAVESSSLAAIQDAYPPTQRREQGTAWRLSGSIRSNLGVAIPNSRLYCIRADNAGSKAKLLEYAEFKPVAVSAQLNGNYQIEVKEYRFLYATAVGHAPSIVQVPAGNQLDVVLNQGRSIEGTIVLPSGRPASGASVRPLFVMPSYVSVSEQGIAKTFRRRIRLPDAGRDWKTIVSSTGEFSMSRLPQDMPVGILVSLPGYRE